MNRRTERLVVLSGLLLAGCTTEAWYKGVQVGAESQCLDQPPGAMERCQERLNNMTYEEYKKEIEKLKKNPPPPPPDSPPPT